MWDPSGQPAYGLTHWGPMRNQVALPIWVAHMGPIYACLSVSIRQKKILKVICDLIHHHKSAINATFV